MNQKNSQFTKLVDDIETMSEDQRQIIADGCEDDERYTISADDYASDNEFQAAVIAEITRLLDL